MSLNTLISLAAFGVAGYLLLKAHQSGALDNLFAPPAGGGEAPPAGGGGCDCSQYGGGTAPPPPTNGDSSDSGSSDKKKSSSSKDKKKKKSNYSVSYMAQRVKPRVSAAGILAQIDPVSGEEFYYKSFASSSSLCSSRYHGKCNTECSKGSPAECRDCQQACGLTTGTNIPFYSGGGGTQIGAVQAGATRDPRRCSDEFNGKCNTECQSPNSTICVTCRAVCEGTFPPVVAPAEGDEDPGGGTGSGGGTGGGDQTAVDPCIAECAGGGGGGGTGTTPAPTTPTTTNGGSSSKKSSKSSGGNEDDESGAGVAWNARFARFYGEGRFSPVNRLQDLSESVYHEYVPTGMQRQQRTGLAYASYPYPWERTGSEHQAGPYAMRAGVVPNRLSMSTRALRSQRASVVTGLPRKAYYVSDAAFINTGPDEDGTARDSNRISMAAGPTYGDYRYIARPQTAANPVASTVSFR